MHRNDVSSSSTISKHFQYSNSAHSLW